MTLRFLLRPWCWVVGHRSSGVVRQGPLPDTDMVLLEMGCALCGKNLLDIGTKPLRAGEVLVFRDGKWRRP